MRRNALTVGIIIATTGLLTACGGDDNDSADRAEVRAIHASSNAPDVDIALNGDVAIPMLAFATASDLLAVNPGTFTVTVEAITPTGDVEVINANVPLVADQETTIIALGNVGGSGDLALGPLVVTAPDADPGAGEVRVQVVHASAAAAATGPLDVYVTAPGDALADSDPIGTFGFKETLGPLTVPAADYRIRVTPENDAGTVVFDSGTVSLAGGADLVISAIDNVGPESAPVRLLVAPEGADSFLLLDDGAEAAVGVGHLSADTPNVDVALDGNFSPPAFENLSFPSVTDFAEVPAGTYDIDAATTGNTASAVGADDVELVAGERFTGYAVGLLNGAPGLELIFSEDDIRSIATEARLRVIHAASQVPGTNGAVDIYLTPEGTQAGALATTDPTIEDFPYKEISEFLSVAPATYEVFVTPADTTIASIGPVTVMLEAGDVTTAIAHDDENDIGGSFALLPVDETTR
ncbi:DUF4397 domain-containing protein [Halofilum ochraceum]|uniref:DUF4397 domain-containing protein n=1 Tax=Halofilum ochraceum TaxID=1611323 RepID=UPI0008D9D54D|nr:DUF4397 domain-containing protein [Halofilum ochraceum]